MHPLSVWLILQHVVARYLLYTVTGMHMVWGCTLVHTASLTGCSGARIHREHCIPTSTPTPHNPQPTSMAAAACSHRMRWKLLRVFTSRGRPELCRMMTSSKTSLASSTCFCSRRISCTVNVREEPQREVARQQGRQSLIVSSVRYKLCLCVPIYST